jgi:hypothetical protein
MLFPAATEYNRRIPKSQFYEHLSLSPAIKHLFTEQIDTIVWQNKLSPSTLHIEEGFYVKEIEIFRVKKNQPELDTRILQIIDEGIPYHLVFLLEYNAAIELRIAYKEIDAAGKCTVLKYFPGNRRLDDATPFPIQGLSMDAVYENLFRRIAGESFPWREGDDLRTTTARAFSWERIDRQIAGLRVKMRNERQFNRQVELHEEIRRLLRERERG